MDAPAPPKFGMGAPVRRLEDTALVTGRGRFTDDVAPDGALRAVVLRSAMAHARISVGGLAAARKMPGIHLIMTAADLVGVGGLPCEARIYRGGRRAKPPHRPLLCGEVVRHVGDPIAFVVADDVDRARDAAEAIAVDYEPLAVVADMREAVGEDAPLVWPELESNVAFEISRGKEEATAAAFARAARVSRVEVINNRVVTNYMEPRGIIAQYDRQSQRFTLTLGCQGVHGMRETIARIIKVVEDRIRVITPDVGGGFGTKAFVYHEYPLAALAAQKLGRPVKWIGERGEHFLVDSQGRDNISVAEMAMDENGRFLAMRIDVLANMGAYLSQYAPWIPQGALTMMTGVYDIACAYARCRGIYTNTVPVDAYRGAGRPEAAYLVERLVEVCGRDSGLGPIEIRKRNFIAPSHMPYETPGGRIYDTGEFAGHLDRALELADHKGFAARAAAATREAGRARGFGIATYIEACAFPDSEGATVTLDDDGGVTLLIGTQSSGQGHATAYAQFVAGHLGVDYDKIRVIQGDSDRVREGGGTGGSRSIPLGVVSVDRAATKLADQLKAAATARLEADAGELTFADGAIRVAGSNRGVTLAELARSVDDRAVLTAYDDSYEAPEPTYPNGTHIAEVETDPDTGAVAIVGYWIVDDFGATVNPMLLEGQVHGGATQGIGQALYEHTRYDGDGQLITASLLDYCLPRAEGTPAFVFETRNVPTTVNPFGIKGAGEAGAVGSCPAVMNAIVDALARGWGVTHIDMPATPERVWRAIRSARG